MRIIDSSCFVPFEKDLLPAEFLGGYAFSLCGGPCAGLFRVRDTEMLTALVRACLKAQLPYKVLGGMTNVLVSDDGFAGVVLLNRRGTVCHKEEPDGTVELTVGSGAGMAALVRYCMEQGISGMEWAAGLPGTAGGAVYGNAGAFGASIADSFLRAEIIDQNGTIRQLIAEDMDYAYRSSVLKRQEEKAVLLNAAFRLKKGVKEQIAAAGEANKEARRASQPVTEHSLGSVFKNPVGESAGKLIQAAGLKGFSIGKATVSMKHANFITTEEGVKSEDYHRLILHVQNTVFEQFGILLEPEIELLGFGLK